MTIQFAPISPDVPTKWVTMLAVWRRDVRLLLGDRYKPVGKVAEPVIVAIYEAFGVRPAALRHPDGKQARMARQAAAMLLRDYLGMGYDKIADSLAWASYRSAYRAIRLAEARLKTDEDFRHKYHDAEELVRNYETEF